MEAYVAYEYISDIALCCSVGMVFGVVFPLMFWLVGSLVDVVRKFSR